MEVVGSGHDLSEISAKAVGWKTEKLWPINSPTNKIYTRRQMIYLLGGSVNIPKFRRWLLFA
jgi:hypothetical protein